jgi:hypothetical protein
MEARDLLGGDGDPIEDAAVIGFHHVAGIPACARELRSRG